MSYTVILGDDIDKNKVTHVDINMYNRIYARLQKGEEREKIYRGIIKQYAQYTLSCNIGKHTNNMGTIEGVGCTCGFEQSMSSISPI